MSQLTIPEDFCVASLSVFRKSEAGSSFISNLHVQLRTDAADSDAKTIASSDLAKLKASAKVLLLDVRPFEKVGGWICDVVFQLSDSEPVKQVVAYLTNDVGIYSITLTVRASAWQPTDLQHIEQLAIMLKDGKAHEN